MLLQTKENLEDFIVKILAEAPNLTVAEVKQKLDEDKKKYTLQAIYKELRKLQNGGVVVKLKRIYNLRLPWALDLVSFANTVFNTYLRSPSLTAILPDINKKEIWHFNNLLKLNDFWSQLLLILVKQSKKKMLLGYNPHTWFYLVQTKQEEQYVKSIGLARGKLYLIVGGRTYFDKWTEKFFDKKTMIYSFGKSIFEQGRSTYLNVIDDYVLTVKLDNNTVNAIENFYNHTSSAEDIDLQNALKIFHDKVKANIWLEKNPEKAERIKGRFSRFFGINFR